MESHFIIEIDHIPFEFLSMNVKRAQLFQVYVNYNNNRRRFHFKEDGKGNFIFALRDDCPADILKYEDELSERIKQRYSLS
jgi:hypothetical protein